MNNTIKNICNDKDFKVIYKNDGRILISKNVQKHSHRNTDHHSRLSNL